MIDYEKQAIANLLAFYTNAKLAKKRDVLLRILKETSKRGIVFALSCSGAYFFRGLIDDFHDYDIIVEKSSINQFIEIFINLGGTLEYGQKKENEKIFASKFFCSGQLDGVEFDIISEFTITTFNTRYTYDFKSYEVELINGLIPVCPIESNLILYGMMIQWQPRRRYKYEIALNFLKQNGVMYPEILKATDLPKFIKNDIESL